MIGLEYMLNWMTRHRVGVVAGILLVSIPALWQIRGLEVKNDLSVWFVDDDPALLRYQAFQETYGNDETIVLAIERPAGFADRTALELLDDYATAVGNVPGIAGVQSAATAIPAAEASHLLSEDATVALIIAHLEPLKDIDNRRAAILAGIDDALKVYGVSARKAGIGVIYEALNAASMEDAPLLLLISTLLMVSILWWSQRNWRAVVMAFASIGITTLWIMGLYAGTGHQLNMITMILPSLVLVVSLACCVQIVAHAEAGGVPAGGLSSRIQRLSFIFVPCLVSALTTAAGFASLISSRMPVVRELGTFAAIGVMLSVLLTMVICTLMFRGGAARKASPENALTQRITSALLGVALQHPKRVLVIATIMTLIGILGITRIEVDTYTLEYLFPDHRVRQDSDFIEQRVGPYTPLDFVLTVEDGQIARADILQALAAWQQAASGLAEVGWSSPRVEEWSEWLNSAASSGPGQDGDAAGGAGAHLKVLDPDGRSLHLSFGIRMQSARGIEQTIQNLSGLAAFPADVRIEVTGYLPLYTQIITYLVDAQLLSLGLASLTIFTMIALEFRNLALTALAVLINVIPLVLILGLMGYTGIRIDVATVTIAPVILGLIDDDTVHILYRLRHEYTGNHADALRKVIATTGHALTTTTLLLVAGFGIMALAEVKSIVWFGVLIATASATALLVDLVLLPALVILWQPELRGYGLRKPLPGTQPVLPDRRFGNREEGHES